MFATYCQNILPPYWQHCLLWEKHLIIEVEHPELWRCVYLHNKHQPRWEEQAETTKNPRQDFPQKENHLLLSSRMNEPSGYIVTSSALVTCFALLRHCQMHLLESRSKSRISCKSMVWGRKKTSVALLLFLSCSFAPPLKHPWFTPVPLWNKSGLYLPIPIHLNFIHGNSVSC